MEVEPCSIAPLISQVVNQLQEQIQDKQLQLDRAAKHFHNGMRAFYFMVPLVLWFFGPLLLVGATMLMIVVVYLIDKTPVMDYNYISSLPASHCKLR